jgi:hypothetical protein
MTTKIWNPHPVSTVIVELLKRKGPTTDAELYDMVREIQGDIGFNVLNKELMRLEIEGAIHVSALARGKRRVELKERRTST